jgi:hypothetical protein
MKNMTKYLMLYLPILILLCCNSESKHTLQNNVLKEEDILNEIDNSCFPRNPYILLPDLSHGYTSPAINRISLFRDENDKWAIVYEVLGFSPRDGSYDIQLNYFGNCLINQERLGNNNQFISNTRYITLVNAKTLLPYFDEEYRLLKSGTISVHDSSISFTNNVDDYKKPDVLDSTGVIDAIALLRHLSEKHTNLFSATDKELYSHLPATMKKIMIIQKWHFDYYDCYTGSNMGIKPSKQEVNQLIAKILVTGDTSLYKPKLPANNDWRYWKDSGKL